METHGLLTYHGEPIKYLYHGTKKEGLTKLTRVNTPDIRSLIWLTPYYTFAAVMASRPFGEGLFVEREVYIYVVDPYIIPPDLIRLRTRNEYVVDMDEIPILRCDTIMSTEVFKMKPGARYGKSKDDAETGLFGVDA